MQVRHSFSYTCLISFTIIGALSFLPTISTTSPTIRTVRTTSTTVFCILRKYHRAFHSQYGYGNHTAEPFAAFYHVQTGREFSDIYDLAERRWRAEAVWKLLGR